MTQGFYENLGVANNASSDDINGAYHTRLAELVRRLRAARRQGADVTILEGQERSLREAMVVLSDPVRRQRYDAYQRASHEGIPRNAEELWEAAKASLVDPVALSAVEVLRVATDLEVGNPFPDTPKPRRWVGRPVQQSAPAVPRPSPPAPKPVTVAPLPPLPELPVVPAAVEIEATEIMRERAAPQSAAAVQARAEFEPTEQVRTLEFSLDDTAAISAHFGCDGRFLRKVRELKGMELSALVDETRISLRYLEAIEANDYDALPAATFVRGYVKEFVRALEISHGDVVEGFMDLFSRHRG
jgi:hypothetical protein